MCDRNATSICRKATNKSLHSKGHRYLILGQMLMKQVKDPGATGDGPQSPDEYAIPYHRVIRTRS